MRNLIVHVFHSTTEHFTTEHFTSKWGGEGVGGLTVT